jgi:hypothetical protein
VQVPLTEAQFQRQVTDLADLLGWAWIHIERMGDHRGRWRTPVSGPLGIGWLDLMLTRERSLLWVELKAQGKYLTEDQKRVQTILDRTHPYYVWRPSDFAQIVEVLTNA